MEFLQKLIEIIIRKHRQLKKLYRVIFALACVVVFVTSYALTLPAITLEKRVAQGMPGIDARSKATNNADSTIDSGGEGGPDSEDHSAGADEDASGQSQEDSSISDDQGEGSGDTDDGVSEEASAEANEDAGDSNDDSDGESGSESGGDSRGESGSGTTDTATDGSGSDSADESDDDITDTATDGSGSDSADESDDGTADAAAGGSRNGAAEAGSEEAAEAATKPADGELLPEGTILTAEGSDYIVYVTVTSKSLLYKGTTLQVREITKEKDEERRTKKSISCILTKRWRS